MKNEDFNQCLLEYQQAVNKLEKFKSSDAFYYMKGFLVSRKNKKKENGHTETYYVRVEYIDKVPHRKDNYVRKAEIPDYIKKLEKKKENRQKYKALNKNVKRLGIQLKRIMKRVGFDEKIYDEIISHRRKHNEFKKNDKYTDGKQNVVSALGEKLRSRAECIVANLAFALRIPYFYEPEIHLSGYNEYDDVYEKNVRPDFSFFINGKNILLELLGMTDNEEYVQNWERKERRYNGNGYERGKNLICVECKGKQNLDSQKIAKVLIDMVNGITPRKTVVV